MNIYKNFLKKENPCSVYFIITILIIGFIGGYSFFRLFGSQFNCPIIYQHLNSNMACRNTIFVKKSAYLSLENNLRKYFDSEKSAGRLIDVGLFFRDLEDGPVFDIDGKKPFISASLIKLPTVMTAMRIADQYPDFLNRKVLYDKELFSDNQDFIPAKKLQIGQEYSVDDLIARTLEYSDNVSNALLVDQISRFNPKEDMILNTFKDLGLILPGDVSQGDLSTKSFSSLFRLLYNASFLSKNSSEKILELLDKAIFKQGIEGGVPEGIIVADKFGERELDYVSKTGQMLGNVNELHDCGIVYYPNNPYLLCVMTKGKSFDNLSKIIMHVSDEVYKEVDSRRVN